MGLWFPIHSHHARSLEIVTSMFKTTITKCWTIRKSTTVIRSLRILWSRGKLLSPKLESQIDVYGEPQFIRVRNPSTETSAGINTRVENNESVIGELLKIQCWQISALKTPGGFLVGEWEGHTFVSFIFIALSHSQSKTGGIPSAFSRGSTHFEISLSILVLTRPASQGTILLEHNRLRFYQSLAHLGEEKYPIPALHNFAVSPKGGKIKTKLRSICKVSA